MTVESIIAITITILSVVCAPVIYIGRSIMQRIDKLESDMDQKISKEEVRTILDDKIEPMNENVKEIKALLYKVLADHLKKD